MQEEIYHFYSQAGGVMPVFAGSRRPRMVGSGFFATLARYASPILRDLGGRVLRVAARTARDVISGPPQRSLGDTLLQHTGREVVDALQSPTSAEPSSSSINKQVGSSLPHRKRPSAVDIFTALKRHRRRRLK